MALRNVYLKIETIPDYSPVDPDPHVTPPRAYRRDCMRNMGHEDCTIPDDEVNARRLTALVYREYLDANYFVPRPDKLVLADVNEPSYQRRVPSALIYTKPGERLRIHVKNADREPHSFHVHGLRYGIDSDGSWPLGVQAADGRRSDEICPGQSWTYTFDVTDEMIGAWPFHDHYRNIGDVVNRGLFGGVVVLPREGCEPPARFRLPAMIERAIANPEAFRVAPGGGPGRIARPGRVPVPMPPRHGTAMGGMPMGPARGGASGGTIDEEPRPAVPGELEGALAALEELAEAPHCHPRPRHDECLHVPIFLHQMVGARRTPVFRSSHLLPGQTFEARFTQPGVYNYYCEVHGIGMNGIVRVVVGGPQTFSVTITDNQYTPNDITIGTVGPGGMGGLVTWTNGGASEHTVTERGGSSIPSFCMNGRSFVGNTPTIEATTGQKIRWYVFNLDLAMGWHNFHTHAQRWSFAGEEVDIRTIGPAESFFMETVAPPVLLLPPHIEQHQHEQGHRHGAHEYRLRGDFLVHCHVEMHMMGGLAGIVRATQRVWLTKAEKHELEQATGLPLDPGTNDCPDVDLDHCEKAVGGEWRLVPGTSEITMMHAVLLPNTTKLLYWGYGPRPDQSRLWDAATGIYSQPANQPAGVTADENIWSGSHAYLDDATGTILEAGGFTGTAPERHAFLFDTPTLTWSALPDMHQPRFYPTTLSLPDGTPMTFFGQDTGVGTTSDGIEMFTGGAWTAPNPTGFNYFYYPWTFLLRGGDLFVAGPQKPSRRFDPTATPIVASGSWNQVYSQRGVNMEGTAALLPLRPPSYDARVLICGGSPADAQQSSEMIDLSAATPTWQDAGTLSVPRSRCTAVLLPDGRVMVAGGATDPRPDGGPVEIFDPSDPGAGWLTGPTMVHRRDYHSSAILLPDGSVLMGGDPEAAEHERYYPSYYFRPRPTITSAPALVAHGAGFAIHTPQAPAIAEVVLMRPGAVTHGFNANQRYVGCEFTVATGTLNVTTPADMTVAPRGWYLLFIVDSDRTPSLGQWIRVSP